jgi:hypothetical protein
MRELRIDHRPLALRRSRSGNNIRMDGVRQARDRAVVTVVMNLRVPLNDWEGVLDDVGEHQLHGARQPQVECWTLRAPVPFTLMSRICTVG